MSADPQRTDASTAKLAVADRLVRVTEAALAFLDLDSLLGELLERIIEILPADTAAILFVEDDGEMLATRAARGFEAETAGAFQVPIGTGFAGQVAATASRS